MTTIKVKPKLSPGTVFVVPIGESRWACGLITHTGRYQLMLGAFSLLECRPDQAVPEIVKQITDGPRWRTRLGKLGFRDGNWRIVGHAEVPAMLKAIPPVYVGPYQGFITADDLITPIGMVNLASDSEVMEDAVPDYVFVEHWLEAKIHTRS